MGRRQLAESRRQSARVVLYSSLQIPLQLFLSPLAHPTGCCCRKQRHSRPPFAFSHLANTADATTQHLLVLLLAAAAQQAQAGQQQGAQSQQGQVAGGRAGAAAAAGSAAGGGVDAAPQPFQAPVPQRKRARVQEAAAGAAAVPAATPQLAALQHALLGPQGAAPVAQQAPPQRPLAAAAGIYGTPVETLHQLTQVRRRQLPRNPLLVTSPFGVYVY